MASEHMVHIDAPESVIQVLADETRVVQILTNLLSNAIKFSPDGSTIRVETAEHSVDTVVVSISDEGRGISTDERGAIFERFHQLGEADARDQGGSGLGLAICKALVEQHGGRIWVEDAPGQGATFKFTLPLAHGA